MMLSSVDIVVNDEIEDTMTNIYVNDYIYVIDHC